MATAVTASPRPIVGLVLGGGGARGAAHVGVIEELERLHVPVDCIAGTSMGAVVAGAWAAGASVAQMRADLGRADWADMFQDNPDYADLNYRSKLLQQQFLPGSETGVRDGGVTTPAGLVAGQKIKLFFDHLVHDDAGERLIEQLPLPLSIIATDIGDGARVVLRDGSLSMAMRASISVPGLMAPLDYRGRKLVDGGLVDNLPVQEVRERCGAQVVIAVGVDTPPLPSDQVVGLLSVTTQVIHLLTEQNVRASVASLRPTDIYIRPELGTIGAADFGRSAEAADRGLAAARAVDARLAALAVSPQAYAAWDARRRGQPRTTPRIDAIEIAPLRRVNPAAVRRYIQQQTGAPLDTVRLDRDLLRVYGDGDYQSVDYAVLDQHGRNVLRLMPVEKSWGPDYLRMALQLESDLNGSSTYRLRLGYDRTWINPLGGDLLVTAEAGSSAGLALDYYQPLVPSQRWFFEAEAGYSRDDTDYFELGHRRATYRSARTALDLSLGVNLLRLGQVKLGWRESHVSNQLETGVVVDTLLVGQRLGGGWLATLDMIQFDRLYFPSRGWSAQASWFSSDALGYTRAAADLRAAWPWRDYVVGSRLSWVGSPRGSLPITDAGRLGGFLNLTGFATGQLIGNDVAYAQLRAERIIGRAPVWLGGDLRFGLALELGKVGQPYTLQQRYGLLNSVAFYLGGETPVGPAYVGLGRGSGGSVNAYLVVGAP
ncbi:MAG: patatin-like phospholipase family protein [Burkholderiales bacterium]|nr:patatin-like phospholipase family protein [Burkholderiales bacterium]